MIPDNCFVYTKKEILNLSKSILHGYAVFDDSLVINTSGLEAYQYENGSSKIPSEGRFSGVFKQLDKFVIKTDVNGQEMLYMFRRGDNFIISNSFLLLSEFASKQFNLSEYKPAALNFLLKNGSHLGEQLISHKTMIEDIEILPINSEVHIDRITGLVTTKSKSYLELHNVSDVNEKTYDDKLVLMLSRGKALIDALSRSGMPMYLSLSGGYDSRVVLGMMSESVLNSGNLYIKSDINREDDFRIASELSESFNLDINTFQAPARENRMSSSDAYSAYMMSCGGTYLPMYLVKSSKLYPNPVARLTGDYASDWSFFKGNALFNGSMEKVSSDIESYFQDSDYSQMLKHDFLSVFKDIGVAIDHPASPIAYYGSIRARHHCGRNWYKSLGSEVLVTPLMSSEFIGLDVYNFTSDRHELKLFTDMFSAIGEWATSTPFHSAKGQLPKQLIDESRFKGGVKLDDYKYRVYGSFGGYNSIFNGLSLKLSYSDDEYKGMLSSIFNRIQKNRYKNIFSSEKFKMMNAESVAKGKLSHDYRTITQMIFVDTVADIVNSSKLRR